MHYIVHVFVKPGKTLEEVMAPHKERYDKETRSSSGHWDWYRVGGRWDGYWDGKDELSALEARTAKGVHDSPYAFIDLYGNWVPSEAYLPGGYWDPERGYGEPKLSYFLSVPDYDKHYRAYLDSVPDDTTVYAVDVHS